MHMFSRMLLTVAAAPLLFACRNDQKDCAEVSQSIANETLETPLFKLLASEEAERTSFRDTFRQELCSCVIPQLKGQSVKKAFENSEPFVVECARSAGETAGARMAGADTPKEVEIEFCGSTYPSSHPSIHCSDAQNDYSALTKFSSLESLTLREFKGPLTFLASLPKLKELEIVGEQFDDLTGVGAAAALEKLEVSGIVRDLTPLAKLAHLHTLVVYQSKVVDVRPLTSLSSLKTLEIHGEDLKDLTPLSEMTWLEELDISSTSPNDLTILGRLTNLKRLEMQSSHNHASLDFLATLKHLEILNVALRDPPSWSSVSALKELKQLDVAVTNFPSFDHVREASKLEKIDARSTPIKSLDGLQALSRLQALNVSDTAIKDLAPLKELKSLRSLDLHETKITDLSPLAELSELESLDLRDAPVKDLTALSGMSNLTELDLKGTKVPAAAVAQLKGKLGKLRSLTAPDGKELVEP